MENDLRHRIIYISVFIACAMICISLLSGLALVLPAVLLIMLLCVNIIPISLMKSKGIQTNFRSNFRLLVLLNSVIFLPIVISVLTPLSADLNSLMSLILVAAVVLVFALTGALIFSPLPNAEPIEEDMGMAMYESKDMVLQPKPYTVDETESRNYIPMAGLKQKSLLVKIMVWLLIVMMILVPFDWSFAKLGYHLWF